MRRAAASEIALLMLDEEENAEGGKELIDALVFFVFSGKMSDVKKLSMFVSFQSHFTVISTNFLNR